MSVFQLHWSLVLNTQDKTKALRILRPLQPYENLIVEKFLEPSSSGIKAYLTVPLTTEWPGVAVEVLQKAVKVGVPSIVFISPEGAYNSRGRGASLEGTITTPSMVGVTWAGWLLVWR
jgi:hypothetical protein